MEDVKMWDVKMWGGERERQRNGGRVRGSEGGREKGL